MTIDAPALSYPRGRQDVLVTPRSWTQAYERGGVETMRRDLSRTYVRVLLGLPSGHRVGEAPGNRPAAPAPPHP
jgi:hypothetical protein